MIMVTKRDDKQFPILININCHIMKFTELAAIELYKKLGEVIAPPAGEEEA